MSRMGALCLTWLGDVKVVPALAPAQVHTHTRTPASSLHVPASRHQVHIMCRQQVVQVSSDMSGHTGARLHRHSMKARFVTLRFSTILHACPLPQHHAPPADFLHSPQTCPIDDGHQDLRTTHPASMHGLGCRRAGRRLACCSDRSQHAHAGVRS